MRILFDLDGTLTDPFPGITGCIRYALERLGRSAPPAEELRWCIGPPLKASFEKLLGEETLADEAVARYRERFSTIGLFENSAYPEIHKNLALLQAAGFTLSVATSKPRVFAERIITHFELAPFFTSVDGSELDGTRVDKTSLIEYIIKRDGLDPATTLMVGDREHDMIGARNNGVRAIGVLWGYGSRQELESHGAACCLSKPDELPSITKFLSGA